jgi:hypothetical protein
MNRILPLNLLRFGTPSLRWRMAQKRTPHRADRMKKPPETLRPDVTEYSSLVGGIGELLEAARRASARAVNALMTATYWEIGRRIVEFEQHGRQRAQYGEELLLRLSADLTARFGRGFGEDNLQLFRSLYRTYPPARIRQALPQISESLIRKSGLSGQLVASKSESPIRISWLKGLADAFPLSWTHPAPKQKTRLASVRLRGCRAVLKVPS